VLRFLVAFVDVDAFIFVVHNAILSMLSLVGKSEKIPAVILNGEDIAGE
jgi:hypothetical protein